MSCAVKGDVDEFGYRRLITSLSSSTIGVDVGVGVVGVGVAVALAAELLCVRGFLLACALLAALNPVSDAATKRKAKR